MSESIYGNYRDTLEKVMTDLVSMIEAINQETKAETGEPLYEHLIYRIKDDGSMREKCSRKGLPVSSKSALTDIKDAIGLRIVTGFIEDIYTCIEKIRAFPGVSILEEKDYITHVKPNGYRSYHLILEMKVPYEDVLGRNPGTYYAEIQLRTIAMDSWASLEHQLKYKHAIKNEKLIVSELKRAADELASCDVSMQTIRHLIHDED
ncbi:MAG: GTP pyrophosphokinase family protein [Eubacterium sp.]|nr:GTP pyrophosphokinase family protein [Eubacterium sp.]